MTAGSQDAPGGTQQREVPAALARRRARITVALALLGLAAVGVIPALVLRPLDDPVLLAFPAGVVAAFGIDAIRAVCDARGPGRRLTGAGHFATARTWSGPRTIDVGDLASVRARRIVGRGSSATYIIAADTAGVRVAVSKEPDIQRIRRAVLEQQSQPGPPPVRVSLLARGAMRIGPLPGWASVAWSLGSIGLSVLVIAGCVGAIGLLAGT
jgi:hypothetical protein